MPEAYALVPILGGAALIVGGTAALVVDRWDLLADANEPRPILVRYTSQATFNLQARPHWIFLAACCIFGPCLMVTAQWQATLASNDNDSLSDALILHGTACALGGFAVALLPMGNALGTIIHIITAGIFASFGINYTFQAWTLAAERGDDGLATVRLLLAGLGMLGGVVTVFSVYPAVSGTEALAAHKKLCQEQQNATTTTTTPDVNADVNAETSPGLMTPQGMFWARVGETCLAVCQISVAITMAVTLLSAAGEVTDVEDSPDAAWVVGVGGGLAMWVLAAVFYATNKQWYATCQAPTTNSDVTKDAEDEQDDNDDDDDGEGQDGDKQEQHRQEEQENLESSGNTAAVE